MTEVVALAAVSKRFGSISALSGLDLNVRQGEVHAFLGPNGAGKSTTLRLILGLLRADAGRIEVLGRDPWRDAVELHRRLAYVPGDVTLWPNLTGGEVIDLLTRLRGAIDRRRRDQLIERFELDPRKRTRTYSKGNRQKVALISALASDVELYLLDEPTSGLDPLMEAAFRESAQQIRAAGRTILLSSHILSEAEALSDRVTIIRAGRRVETGTLGELRHLTRSHVQVRFIEPVDDWPKLDGVHDVAQSHGVLTAEVDAAALKPFLALISQRGMTSLECRPPTLEDLFLQHYTGEPAP